MRDLELVIPSAFGEPPRGEPDGSRPAPLRFAGLPHAQRFVSRCLNDQRALLLLRGLLGRNPARAHGRIWTDHQVLEETARWLAYGKLQVVPRRRPVMASVTPVEEPVSREVPFAPEASPVPLAKPTPAPPPPKADLARQADTLRSAADEGTPFCEECARAAEEPEVADPLPVADDARQAATLQDAARSGVPFCEECMKKAARQAQGASLGTRG